MLFLIVLLLFYLKFQRVYMLRKNVFDRMIDLEMEKC